MVNTTTSTVGALDKGGRADSIPTRMDIASAVTEETVIPTVEVSIRDGTRMANTTTGMESRRATQRVVRSGIHMDTPRDTIVAAAARCLASLSGSSGDRSKDMCKSAISFAADESATEGFDLSINPPSLEEPAWIRSSGFGTFGNYVVGPCGYRHIVCIDRLGEAKKLVSCGNGMLELTTTDGVYLVSQRVLPAFHAFGFVGIKTVGIPGKGAYYFDIRIAAALWSYEHMLCAEDNHTIGSVLPLMSEDEAWCALKELEHPGSWACEQVFYQVAWTNKSGAPIWNPDTDRGLYDLQKMENSPRCLATLPKRLSHLAKLDYQLRKYAMLCKPDPEFKKLYMTDPYEYWRNINNCFAAKRMVHYENLVGFSRD